MRMVALVVAVGLGLADAVVTWAIILACLSPPLLLLAVEDQRLKRAAARRHADTCWQCWLECIREQRRHRKPRRLEVWDEYTNRASALYW